MATAAPVVTENLLDPISAERPAGADLRWTPDWDRIKEARRADDDFSEGKWAKKERKSANWRQVQELGTAILRGQSKDLQIALWLTEANVKLHGFAGLRDSLRLIRELLTLYWDRGLYPLIEEGPEDRAGPFTWMNDKLIDSVLAIPITVRDKGEPDYSYIDLVEARRVGSEAGWRLLDGETDEKRKREYDAAVAAGRVTLDLFDAAVRDTKREAYEEFAATFKEASEEYKALEKVIDEKFGEAAPNLAACRAAFRDLDREIEEILKKKSGNVTPAAATDTPSNPAPVASSARDQVVMRVPIALATPADAPGEGGSWAAAEALIRSGQVDQGLAEMARLAARETTGRDRFHRRLVLAEVCLGSKRERLARSILEELSAQIDKYQLEQWESTELVGAVWTRLYRLYKQQESESDRASVLYERLCKLDPWQALKCQEG